MAAEVKVLRRKGEWVAHLRGLPVDACGVGVNANEARKDLVLTVRAIRDSLTQWLDDEGGE